jgi:hypothetical protein
LCPKLPNILVVKKEYLPEFLYNVGNDKQQKFKNGGKLPMSIIRQGSLFDMQDFYDLEPSKRFERFEAVFSSLRI